MNFWYGLVKKVDALSERFGDLVSWMTFAMIMIGALNAIARTISQSVGMNLSSNTFIEAQWYLFSLVFLLGAGYTLKHNAHVRVDVLYSRVSPRKKVWINLFGILFFLIPFCIMMISISIPSVMNSWSVLEQSPDPGGLPRYPLKTVLPIAFALLILQGIAELIRSIGMLRGDLPLIATDSEGEEL